jgi:iron complex transport system ATP-binding protein
VSALLETEDLSVTVGSCRICRSLGLRVASGECWGLLGRNGVGKTTLLHTLAGLRPADSGRIRLLGKDMAELPRSRIARLVGILFQHVDDPFPSSVLETALVGRHPHLRPWQWESREDMERVRSALRALDLESMAQRPVSTLSGGERQRLAIATLLVQDPKLLLLDEPTSHLDLGRQLQALALLRQRVKAQGGALIAVLHDVNLAARYCDRLLLLFGEEDWVQGPPDQVLVDHHLRRLYGHPLIAVNSLHGKVFLPS